MRIRGVVVMSRIAYGCGFCREIWALGLFSRTDESCGGASKERCPHRCAAKVGVLCGHSYHTTSYETGNPGVIPLFMLYVVTS